MSVIDVTSLVRTGTKNNKIWQMDSGTLVSCSYASFTIARSTNNGQTWTDVYTDAAAGQGLMMFEDSNHNMYVGTHKAGQFGYIVRSADDGQNFTKVLTMESSSTWRMAEDSLSNLYATEYSTGSEDANELYAYNVWKSTNSGLNWVKWLQYPHQSSPGAKDSIRHIHNFSIDSTDQRYCTAGDIDGGFVGTYVGTMYQINVNGTFGTAVGTFGNGPISFCEADDGGILLGSDLANNGSHEIWKYDRSSNTKVTKLSIKVDYATEYSSFIYDIRKGKDGVLYAQANTEGGKRGAIFASADDGATWHLLDIQGYWGAGVHIYVNPNVTNSRVLVSHASNNYNTIPDFTRNQLNSFVSGNRIRRAVDWV